MHNLAQQRFIGAFTSSTGGKYQENALAMTQIPTNVTSQAALSVNGQEFSSAVEAVKKMIR